MLSIRSPVEEKSIARLGKGLLAASKMIPKE
jgi:hypothetical protein